ncbi:hypothetical protein L1987_01194 [Smallanthus sonchifolius]|uniref:Uncharacterized protein n=1 Tax=Smallanthus sonchifolius TaxID=185202 RepID=A0ACB9K4F2_9ASTR|nr:hypothetical protein L1987_87715 [Smallanthus sonchifolius]KAI3827127.1 hypothetical protein L1987_01194 [Smallanthus sonchifolius]
MHWAPTIHLKNLKRKWGKWVSEIRLPNSRERIWLGSYDSPEKAARAFNAALFCLRGNTANFNFPHQPPNIPGGTELHPSQIQAVAAQFANSSSSSHELQVSNTYSTSSFLMDGDIEIFPGFDDYFMPLQPPLTVITEKRLIMIGFTHMNHPSCGTFR